METTGNRPPDAEGKTKVLTKIPGTALVCVKSKKDITGGDGAKRDAFEKKDVYATMTTCRIFELLRAHGIPVAYRQQVSPIEFEAEWTDMIPLEVVARRVIGGKSSYRKRNPHIAPGTRLETLVVEFFLKTTDKQFKGISFPKDDPLIRSYGPDGIAVCRPDMPKTDPANAVIAVDAKTVYGKDADVGFPFREIERLVRDVFLILEGAWAVLKKRLCDIKIEVGYTAQGKLVVSDVIDADSWRLEDEAGNSLDKQPFRDGSDIVTVASIYEEVARLVERFGELHAKPRIILWCASEKDDAKPFIDEIERLGSPAILAHAVGSVHKRPEACLRQFRQLLGAAPADTVVIAYVGRSNGAGPTFACDTHVPVITVSSTVSKSPHDIWSSVNVPSDNPLLFQMHPANAIQAALGILSSRNPGAYLARRKIVEDAHLDHSNSPTFGRNY